MFKFHHAKACQILRNLAGLTLGLSLAACDKPAENPPEPSTDVLTPQAIYDDRCRDCHINPETKAPSLQAMQKMSPATIAFALTNGKMKTQAEGLSTQQRFGLAEFIAGQQEDYVPPATALCKTRDIDFSKIYVARWGLDNNNTAAVGSEISKLNAKNVKTLKLKWAFELPDSSAARSQPVITTDTVFIAAVSGEVFALDRSNGCIKWHYHSPVPLRTALTYAEVDGQPTLFFGDRESFTSAVNANSGELIWRKDMALFEYSIQTGAVTFHIVELIVPVSSYEVAVAQNPQHECCKSHGGVHRVDAKTGEIEWTTHMTPDAEPKGETKIGVKKWGPSGVSVWSTPMVDATRGVVYIGTAQNTSAPATELSDAVVALDWETGKVVWHYQATAGDTFNNACTEFPSRGPNCPSWAGPDFDFGASIILTKNADGKEILLAGQKSGDVYALDPDNKGAVIWRTRVGQGSAVGGVHWGMAVADNKVFAPVNDPDFPGSKLQPGLYALNIDTGEQVWEYRVERGCKVGISEYFSRDELYPDCPFHYAFSAAVSIANDVIFAPALNGIVRAFDIQTGEVLWQFDTLREFETVTGVKAHGGAMDSVGVQLADEMVYMQSGYTFFGELPGNVFLAFALEGD